MKTIFLPIFQGVEAKNVLRTDIFKLLKIKNNIRIIIFVSNKEKKEYFENEFNGKNIFYEVVNNYKNTSLSVLFSFLRIILSNSRTMQIKRKIKLNAEGGYPRYFIETLLSKIFARTFFRRVARWIDFNFVKDDNFGDIFDKYRPDLVFSAHIFGDMEASMIKQAKKRNVKTIGFINSWDKITSRGIARISPDKLIVHNEIIENEAIEYLDIKKADIFIAGIPHYDMFFSPVVNSRDEFLRKIGAWSESRIILVCPMGRTFSDIDADIINLIVQFKLDGKIPNDIEILVRFPPNDNVDLIGIDKNTILMDHPGKRFSAKRGLDWDMDSNDMQHLCDTLFHSSLVISPPSSICIDAAVFNKPIINVEFKKYEKNRNGINIYYKMEHYSNLVKTGGIRFVIDKEDLLKWINIYLNAPDTDFEGRKRIVDEQCWRFDGNAGRRVVDFIVGYIS